MNHLIYKKNRRILNFMSKKRTLDPIALLRESIMSKRKIVVKQKYLYFGQTRVLLKTQTGKAFDKNNCQLGNPKLQVNIFSSI